MSLPEAQYANPLFLNRTLKEACEMFNKSRGTKRKVALSTFCELRPKRIKLQSKIPIASSLCDTSSFEHFWIEKRGTFREGCSQKDCV